ncbi:hypothetical protein V6N13_108420 [Hibiscus sabdariffa]
MESEKRKRRDEDGKRAKGGESTPVADEEEEEEEEFSAILKRIRVAGDNDVNKDEDSDLHPPLDLNLKPAVSKQDS